jgi:hypothetical protein
MGFNISAQAFEAFLQKIIALSPSPSPTARERGMDCQFFWVGVATGMAGLHELKTLHRYIADLALLVSWVARGKNGDLFLCVGSGR